MSEEVLVSVVMGVYNTKTEYLQVALDSVLNQTYRKLEFIVIDDASEDWCSDFLEQYRQNRLMKYHDKRLQLFRNPENKGLTACLNIGLQKTSGVYVARMDSDDICLPDRIERQVTYLEEHKDIDVLACGTYIYTGNTLYPKASDVKCNKQFAGIYRKFERERMKVVLSMANIEFTHPTVLFRSEFLQSQNLQYDESVKKAQDYNMWVKCSKKGRLDSVQELLFISRIHADQIGTKQTKEQRCFADVTKIRCLKELLPDASQRQQMLYACMRDTKLSGSVEENIELVRALVEANDRKKIYDPKIYREEMFFWWLRKALYRENQPDGIRILTDLYMIRNILKIAGIQMFRYIADLLHKKRIRLMWAKELEEKIDEQDLFKNERRMR